MWTLVDFSVFDTLRFYFREMSLQMCFTKMWTGVMWTSQIVVTTQRHPNQGLVGSGPVRRVIPIEIKKIMTAGKERGKM